MLFRYQSMHCEARRQNGTRLTASKPVRMHALCRFSGQPVRENDVDEIRPAIERDGLRTVASRQRCNVAGIIWTYQCSAACRHCLFACGPGRPHVVMSTADCLACLRAFHELRRVIHLAGGECFLFYDEMLAMCREAQRQGVAPHFVETNSSWCTSDAVVDRRFRELRDAGILGVLLSCDPYHQEFVPAERVQRSYLRAVELFGEQNVMGGAVSASCGAELEAIARDEAALRDHVRSHPPGWIVGNAAKHLAQYLDRRPLEAFEQERCADQFDIDRTWEFHFDPYGNLMTNCGIALGNARRMPPSELLTQESIAANPLVRIVCDEGPVGLMRLAAARGLTPRIGYVQKCEVCYHARAFLRPHFPHILCPDEIYA